MTITEIRQILESPYNRNIWKSFLQAQFTNNKLNAEDRIISLSDNTVSKQCLSLGFYEIDNYTKIGIFEIELNDKVNLARNRVALRNLLKDITKQMAGAMVVFVQGEKWRFSYISKRKFLNKKTNTIEDKETAPKRYTYLFGKGEKALTAAMRFDKLIQKQKDNLFDLLSLNDFEDAFSVEKLGKEFFKNYKEIYEDFVEYITGNRYVKKGSKWEKTKVHDPHFDFNDIFKNDSKAVRDFFKRMMGRIVFLYFIQKKGWLAVPKGKSWDEGNTDFLYQLFKNAKYKELFYSDYLVKLFFDTLNNEKSEDENNDLRFPYLNGGLFSDEQDRQYNKLALPSSIFEKLFENFNNYNFTIYEDAPDEHTVAVDPEMLGHIFENLLEDNKDKGAFYTPKEIVHYMCKESLKAYLVAKDELEAKENNVAQTTLENIIQQQELNAEEVKYADKNAYKIIDALESVKICDPAIGSGAFPMGLLQEIFNAQVYLQELKGFTKAKTDADIKKHIIEESIFGVDIDEGAVDIARLRFWLSLVVDEPKPQPLPNLSFKIVCANTLIPLGKAEGDLGGTKAIADEIEAVRERYFDANKDTKKDLERQFRNLQAKLWTTAKEWATGKDVDIYKKISEFNPFEDKSCSWFDPWWMFGIQDGFDIVIGNPPYVTYKGKQVVNINDDLLRCLIESYPNSAEYKVNSYALFIEKGLKLLKNNGTLTYIIPSTILQNEYLKKIRKYIITKHSITQIVSFSNKVFDATTDSIILFLNKSYNKDYETKTIRKDDLNFSYSKDIKLFKQDSWNIENDYVINIKANKFEENIIEEIEHNINYIQDYFVVYVGIVANGIKKFLSETKINSNYKKYLQGKHINNYQISPENVFINFIKEELHSNTDENVYLQDEKILVRKTGNKLIAVIDSNQYFTDQSIYNLYLKENRFIDLKFVTGLLNSKLMNYYFNKKMITNPDVFPYIKGIHLKKLPIKNISKNRQQPFIYIVKYLTYLKNVETISIYPHTSNERIASHFEDILDMMVYELYFEEHMKEVGIDVLQFVTPQLESLQNQAIESQIKSFYEWYQTPENAVRQRMMLIDTRSPNILAVINKSV